MLPMPWLALPWPCSIPCVAGGDGAPGTLGGEEVDEDCDRGDEHAGGNDVDDVEEGLALDEQVEHHLLVASLLCVQQQLGWPVPDGPFPVLCRGKGVWVVRPAA